MPRAPPVITATRPPILVASDASPSFCSVRRRRLSFGPVTGLLLVSSAVVAFLLSAAITPLVGRLAERFGMLDMPGGRRMHPRPIPRPGGLAIALAFGVTIFAFWIIDRVGGHPFLLPEE